MYLFTPNKFSQKKHMSQQIKDLKKRTTYAKYELERVQLSALIGDKTLSKEIKAQCVRQLNNLPRNSSLARVRNRCLLTGRGRGVHRFCRLSRIKIRELACSGRVVGWSKSSW